MSESISKGEYDFEEDSDTDAESIYENLKVSKPNKDIPEKSLVWASIEVILTSP